MNLLTRFSSLAGRAANSLGEKSERIYTRDPPKRVRIASALLTKAYHGSRL